MKLIFILNILLWTALSFAQKPLSYDVIGEHVKIRAVVPQIFSVDEETLVGLHFELEEEWHVYWKNPGDSGAAPKFDFTTSTAKMGPVLWPAPIRIPVAHLTNIGYEKNVTYLFSTKPTSAVVDIDIDLEWLVCKVECIPGFGKIKIKRNTHNKPSVWLEADLDLIKQQSKLIPSSADTAPFKIKKISLDETGLKVEIPSEDFDQIELYPVSGEYINAATPVKNKATQEFIFKINTGIIEPKTHAFVAGLKGQSWQFENVSVTEAKNQDSLLLLIIFSVLGGFILNLMPCVFPVISIKAFSLLKTQGSERVRECILYSLGVVTTFLILGILFLGLRYFGSAVGWGFQLQSPVVILFLILLFWLMALNFLDVIQFGTSTMNYSSRFLKNSSSFGTGVLSVFIAAPCTGPFMGTALGAAISLPALSALLLFIGLGFGLALPFVLFATFPKVLTILPKPGPWMETLKHFFAFPLFATVIWLLWVLGQQTSTDGWFLSSIALFVISLAVWLAKQVKTVQQIIIYVVTVATLFMIGQKLNRIHTTDQRTQQKQSNWLSYDETKINEARKNKQAVFIDFTAAWCITCQVNKQTVLDTAITQELFKKSNILLIRADWTRYDATISAALTRLGRSSVPVYAFYASDGSAVQILPQILTDSIIENLINKEIKQ